MQENRPRVACVDDEESNLIYLRDVLSPYYDVTTFKNPIELLKINRLFDCYLIDLHMPPMSGIDLTNKIVNNPNYGLEPILLITSDTSGKFRSECYEKGATSYLDRFVSNDELLTVIRVKVTNYLSNSPVMRFGNLTLNRLSHTAQVDSSKIELTMDEYRFLKVLCENSKKGVTSEHLSFLKSHEIIETFLSVCQKTWMWDYQISDTDKGFIITLRH